MKIGYIGNFDPDHSTENHVRQALELLGHELTLLQENRPETWTQAPPPVDLMLWTRTGWDWRSTCGWSTAEAFAHQHALLEQCRIASIPTVAYHLDRWWGLHRQVEVAAEPFFRCDLVITADGGHDKQWADAGVNHRWLPPGVSELECVPAAADPNVASDVAFVGSWQPGYHAEWQHRPQLVQWLRNTQPGVRFWPPAGEPAVRGEALRHLYASVKILVGDSCLVGGATHYWSDRIPETLGRGGFLLHPWVEGLDEHFVDGLHLVTWPLGDFDRLQWLITHYLEHDDVRQAIADSGRQHVLDHHTYTVRMRQMIELAGL